MGNHFGRRDNLTHRYTRPNPTTPVCCYLFKKSDPSALFNFSTLQLFFNFIEYQSYYLVIIRSISISFRPLTDAEAQGLLDCRMGGILSTILFTHSPCVYKFVPSLIGLDLWHQGASQKTIQLTNQLGLSVSSTASRNAVDGIAKEYEAELVTKIKQLEKVYVCLIC